MNIKAISYDPAFAPAFPLDTPPQKTAFNLLNRAYIDARYKKEYRITRKQLEYLADRIRKLSRLAKKICTTKIQSFTAEISGGPART